MCPAVAFLAQVGCFARSILLARWSLRLPRFPAALADKNTARPTVLGPSWAGTPHAFPFGWRSLSLSFYLYLAGLIILALVLADKYYFIFIILSYCLGSPSPSFWTECAPLSAPVREASGNPYSGCYPLISLVPALGPYYPLYWGFRQGVISCIISA